MITQNRGTIAFAVCGSFCTLEAALQSARALTAQGWHLLPVMSFAARQDTRFGTGNYWKEQLEAAAGHPVLDTLQAVEPLGPRKMAQALVVAPCTGATLSRLAAGLSDTPVTLAAKSLLRVGCPVVLAVSTNDGLGASGENIARLFQRKQCSYRLRLFMYMETPSATEWSLDSAANRFIPNCFIEIGEEGLDASKAG